MKKSGFIRNYNFSYKKWNNEIENKKIIQLKEKLYNEEEKFKKIQKNIQDQIDKIHEECDHEYRLVSEGLYEDYYVCKICNHERLQ